MDIVTHAGIGLIAAAPIIDRHPELALAIVAGSVLPDLDALGRIFGKRAFLRIHQTWSHAIPVHAALSTLGGCIAQAFGLNGFVLGTGLFTGLAIHSFLDFTNTLGVTLLAPFSRKRFCVEWIFFIDVVVLLLTLVVTSLTVWRFLWHGGVPAGYAVTYFSALALYICLKAMLRKRAGLFAPEAISLIPSGLCPWRYFGVIDGQTYIRLFQINAITGKQESICEQDIFDEAYDGLLVDIPEFELMRELSPAYHIVKACKIEAGEFVLCRDLRTRNFGTTFGDLEVLFDRDRRVKHIKFHV